MKPFIIMEGMASLLKTIPLIYNLSIMFEFFIMIPLLLIRRILLMWKIINTFMHVDHDKNDSCDGYIVDFIHDATGSFYERGRNGFTCHNNIKSPLFLLKILKLHLLCHPMLLASCFNNLFSYKILLHRKWVRLKCV